MTTEDRGAIGDRRTRRYLYDAAKKLNLVTFIEQNAGVSFAHAGDRWTCLCPMPHHKDSKPSFGVRQDPDGVWVFNCFGCHSKGTIIDFCKDYYSLSHPAEALILVAGKAGIEVDSDLIAKAVRDARVTVDENKRLECAHLVAASSCRRLLRAKGMSQSQWVAEAYWRMNGMLDRGDIAGVERVGNEAIARMMEAA